MTMHLALQRLGVAPDTDERGIRRAYARELKLIDQEANPAGFQALREAYDAALYWARDAARQAEAAGQADGDGSGIVPAPPASAQPLQQPEPASPQPPRHPGAASPSAQSSAQYLDDGEADAGAVFAGFIERCAGIGGEMPVTDDAPWERELRRSLADARLVSIVARDSFERLVAERLVSGWQPGHEALLVAATRVFNWDNDRRRVGGLGRAGAELDAALEQRAMFELQPDEERARQRRLIERLHLPQEPRTRELVLHSPTLEVLIARFPEWLALVASVPRIMDWRERNGRVPGWRRKLTYTGWRKPVDNLIEKQSYGGINWLWVAFIAIVWIVRACGNSTHDNANSGSRPASVKPFLSAAASELLERGDEQMNRGDTAGAIASYGKVVESAPDHAQGYANRAMAYFYEEKYVEAKSDVEQALSRSLSNVVALRVRGMLAMRDKNYMDALADLTRAIQLDADNGFTYTQRAFAYEGDGQNAAALSDALDSIRLQPSGNTQAYMLAARLHKAAGDPDKAEAQADAMLAANAGNARSYIGAARIHMLLGQKAKTLAVLKRGAATVPDVSINVLIAELLPAKDLAGRRAAIDAALAIKPDSGEALKALAALETDAGHHDAAAAAYTTALAGAAPGSGERTMLLLERGAAHLKNGNAAASAADFKAVRDAGKTASALNDACWYLATRSLALQAALDLCGAALQKNPASAPTLDSKGLVLLRMGRYEEAIAAYSAALAQRKDFPMSLYGRGIAQRRLGREKEARADLQAAAAISSDVAAVFEEFGVK